MPDESPTGDVQYDPTAEKEAVERMHAEGTGDEHEIPLDPEGGHDPEALKEAAERMLHREPDE